jgi:tRNA pseudouridine55 synthase
LTEGIILLDKPPGLTSFQSLSSLKKCLDTRRVGHAGTLDKFAEGLLIVMVGRMTRLCAVATAFDKEYLATFIFGTGTDTLDPEGAVTGNGPVPTRAELEAVLPEFRGAISQVPPMYSAIHVDGKRASAAARQGETVQLRPRVVTVETLEILDHRSPDVAFRISCSKGTYVRSLARDIAARLGTVAHVSQLRRTRIGGFSVADARTPQAFDPTRDILAPTAFFKAAPALGRLTVRGEWVDPLSRGVRLSASLFTEAPSGDGIFGAFSPDDRLVAVIEKAGAVLKYLATFPVTPATSSTSITAASAP